MDKIDHELQQRVWQRVHERPETVAPEGLLLDERTDAAQLRLWGQGQQTAERIAILRTICRLSGIPDARVTPKTEVRSDDIALRRLMGRLLRRHRQYASLCDHPEYGILYDALAGMTRDAAVMLAKQAGAPLRNGKK